MLVVDEALNVGRARAERFERDAASHADIGPQWLVERRERSDTSNRSLAERGESLQKLQSKVAALTAELRKWRKLAAEKVED